MHNCRTELEKLRKDAAECTLIRHLATDEAKRELFSRLADRLNILAEQVEAALVERKAC